MRSLKAFAVMAASLLVATGCTSVDGDAGTSESGYTTVTAGTLTVCADIPYPPFEEEDPGSEIGYKGFDVDLVKEISSRLGLGLAIRDVDFDGLQSGAALVSGQCDMAASAVSITEERKANLDFSEPYYDSLQSLLVRADSGITSLDDMAGKTIGVQTGSTGKTYAEEHAPADATLLQLDSDGMLWPAIQADQIQAILQDLPVNQAHTEADPQYVIAATYETDEQYGFAFAKGKNPELREGVDTALQEMRDDGTYQKIYDSYFAK
ncbi:MAG: transporter substrate-binding domain-containing protein [Propionibacteriaceae bacterium]|jgi:polar amino acid transport system substrate-binding protein|nr:transporter substrate-binding domain-containing protein [Propionibacteriaceae bacterium]